MTSLRRVLLGLGQFGGRRYFLIGYPKDGCNLENLEAEVVGFHFLTENGWYQLDVYFWNFLLDIKGGDRLDPESPTQ